MKVTRKLVILESPYAGEVERNTQYARRCIRDSLARNEAPIASHLLYTQPTILNDEVHIERKIGIEAGLEWCRVAELMVVYTDLGISPGMTNAVELAKKLGLPVEYRNLVKPL